MVVTHYTGALRTLFYSFVSTAFFGFSFLAVSVSAFFGEPAFFGAKEIVILLPSNKGICSTFAYSSKSFAKRSNNTSPCSLKRMERPLKNTYAFTLSQSCQNPMACFNLKL